ncbi:uncharacterized protein LOC134818650 [Bolinopsis microptera]|uniref:uncharacterized protein LOC134818650 n=1 Tax=Bolinopsis microptera TaxID=2820187 RepID=UPI00307AEA1E
MLYLTDLDYDAEAGHNIAEIEIFGLGEMNRSVRRCDILPIVRSKAKSWYKDSSNEATHYAPEKAYDGDYTTTYRVKDIDAEGNFLKLFLSQKYRIGTVKLTNVKEDCCEQRILGTVVMVYSTEGEEETKVADCGEEITDYDDSVEFQTFSLDCKGAAGDMIYITDTELDQHENHGKSLGHLISEANVLEAKEETCGSLPQIDRLVTKVKFPIVEDTVIEISCNHPWYGLSGAHMITCAKDQEFIFEEAPSCTKDVGLSCLPLDTKKEEQAYLPVKTTGGDVTWDKLTWAVVDQSGEVIVSHTCLEKCGINEMFLKVDVAGVYEYRVKMLKEGEELECGSELFVDFGKVF